MAALPKPGAPFVFWELVVFLVEDGFSIPAQAFQKLAVSADHLVEAADVGMHVSAALNNAGDVLLHISA